MVVTKQKRSKKSSRRQSLMICVFGQAIRVALGRDCRRDRTRSANPLFPLRVQPSRPLGSNLPEVVSQGSEATDRIIFTDGESRTVSVNLDSTIQYDRRSVLLEAYDTFRNLLVNTNDKLESLGETLGLELSFQNLIDSFPTHLLRVRSRRTLRILRLTFPRPISM